MTPSVVHAGDLLRLLSWLAQLFRRVLHVRIVEDNYQREEGGLVFEVENVSQTKTSLSPTVEVSMVHLSERRAGRRAANVLFDLRELERALPPYEPKLFHASARTPLQCHPYWSSWFRVYLFRPAKGRATRVRVRNVTRLEEQVPFFRFRCERLWFRLTGKVKARGPQTIDEWQARRRSRGPH